VGYGGIFDSWQEAGPLARRVEDLALVTSVIAGPDGLDAAIAPMPWPNFADVDVRKLRVAFYADDSLTPTDAATIATVKAAAAFFEELGCSVREDLPRAIVQELEDVRAKLTPYVWPDLHRLADKWGSKAVSPTITARYENILPPTATLTELLERQDAGRSKLLNWMKNYDLVINPVVGTPAQPINLGVNPAARVGPGYNGLHNVSGYPVVVVRAGTSPEGLPIGVQLIGQPWREDHVIAAGQFLESKTGGWQAPVI
jgi:amidase